MTCVDCRDLGIVIDCEATYACHCDAGAKAREPWYWPSDRNKERPVYAKVWPSSEQLRPVSGKDAASGEKPE